MRKLLLFLFVLLGLGGGVGAGFVLRPPPEEPEPCDEAADCAAMASPEMHAPVDPGVQTSFANLKKQFVVPVLKNEKVVALVVASLALEVDDGMDDAVFQKEPKLRDAFLQVLFVHAHSGGFDGDFTKESAINDLKARLLEVARPIMKGVLHDVLLTEIVRQDLS